MRDESEVEPFAFDVMSRASPGEGGLFQCQNCRESLHLHQPRHDEPTRLLGTCGACGDWHLVGLAETGERAIVIHLPLSEYTGRLIASA